LKAGRIPDRKEKRPDENHFEPGPQDSLRWDQNSKGQPSPGSSQSNLKSLFISALAVLSTWICLRLDISADFPLTLIATAIVVAPLMLPAPPMRSQGGFLAGEWRFGSAETADGHE